MTKLKPSKRLKTCLHYANEVVNWPFAEPYNLCQCVAKGNIRRRKNRQTTKRETIIDGKYIRVDLCLNVFWPRPVKRRGLGSKRPPLGHFIHRNRIEYFVFFFSPLKE